MGADPYAEAYAAQIKRAYEHGRRVERTRKYVYLAIFVLGVLFFIASFFTGAKAEPMCERKIPPYAVSKEAKCAIEALAQDKSFECGTLMPERKP